MTIWLSLLLKAQPPNSRGHPECIVWLFSSEGLSGRWWHIDYLGSFPSGKEKRFVPKQIYSGYRYTFLFHSASASTTTCRLTECFIHCLWQGDRFYCQVSVPIHGIHWSYHVTHDAEAANFMKWPKEDSVTVSTIRQHLVTLGCCPKGMGYILK